MAACPEESCTGTCFEKYAAVIDGTTDELIRALIRRAAFQPEHVADAFAVDAGDVARVIGDGPLRDDEFIPAIEAIASDDALRTAIVESSAELRSRVMRYLQRAIDPDEQGRVIVCDIGWGGTIQEAMTEILKIHRFDGDPENTPL